MALPIVEQPLYGEIKVETSPWTASLTWTDRTADLVNGVNYSIGGRVGQPGSSPVDVGTLNATFKNMASVPNVGALIRISFSRVAGYAFVGYVQDVSQRIVFDDSISYNTPITLTTLNCLDWVGYVGQFQVIGVGGADYTTGVVETDSSYQWSNRIAALNLSVDATYATKMITAYTVGGLQVRMGDTDFVGSIADHLDLVSRTAQTYWHSSLTIPTDITTGRDDLIVVRENASLVSSGKTFTDVVGSAGQLHYTEIDFENSSQNVANNVTVNNRARLNIPDEEVTQIGGFGEENFLIINNQQVIGLGIEHSETRSDSTSITTYGQRLTAFESNRPMTAIDLLSGFGDCNLVSNPSVEYSDDGYFNAAGATFVVRRGKPIEDTGGAFSAYSGEWAIRARVKAANALGEIRFQGSESDGTPVIAGRTYYMYCRSTRQTGTNADSRARAVVYWYDANENLISFTTGSQTALTTVGTWVSISSGAALAPAGAVRAILGIQYTRSGGGNLTVGSNYFLDAMSFNRTGISTYFDGDSETTTAYVYTWTGVVGGSPSYRVKNEIDTLAKTTLALYSSTSNRATRIRWNAQESLTSVPSLYVGSTISLVYAGTTTTYRIVGIDGNIDPERYMIDYYLTKV